MLGAPASGGLLEHVGPSSLWESALKDLSAAGNRGTILHHEGRTWTPMKSGFGLGPYGSSLSEPRTLVARALNR